MMSVLLNSLAVWLEMRISSLTQITMLVLLIDVIVQLILQRFSSKPVSIVSHIPSESSIALFQHGCQNFRNHAILSALDSLPLCFLFLIWKPHEIFSLTNHWPTLFNGWALVTHEKGICILLLHWQYGH